ncbi:hypothetical protein T281_17730, partial [Rhodomicrobium udaipurense JA643]
GQAYLVGEQGPELFVPGRSGSIVPNGGARSVSAGGANISITIDKIVIEGGGDVNEIAQKVGQVLEAELRRRLRGLQADYA